MFLDKIISLPAKLLSPSEMSILISLDEETRQVIILAITMLVVIPLSLFWLGLIIRSIKFVFRSIIK